MVLNIQRHKKYISNQVYNKFTYFFIKVKLLSMEGGDIGVYYTSPQSLTFSYSLTEKLWGLLMNFD